MPINLTERVSKQDLARLIVRLARTKDASELCPAFSFEEDRLYSPCLMLGLVTYAFAVGIYSSERISILAREDEELRRLCPDLFPNAEVVKCFRERNRLAIQDFLARAIQAVWEVTGEYPGAGQADNLNRNIPVPAKARERWVACEANEWMRRADGEDRRVRKPA